MLARGGVYPPRNRFVLRQHISETGQGPPDDGSVSDAQRAPAGVGQDDAPPLTVSNDQCKWLLLKRNGKIMVLFCTWNEKAEDLTVKIDTRALEIALKTAVNVESDEELNIAGGKFSFEMPGYGTRIFRCE
ncbi:MAG: hypothetical protein KGZ25_14040 [Planctomycetes bacterium]|nr:hypothetical protein [Planctomycetota bacterium]